jgi:multiple sugar transport system substrate-binding protein
MQKIFTRTRKLPAVAAVMTASLVLAGCAADTTPDGAADSTSPANDAPLTILSQWGASDAEGLVLAETIAAYELETGRTVELTVVAGEGSDAKRTFEATVLAGSESDLVFTNMYSSTVNWVDDGATVAVDEYVTAWGLDSVIQPSALDVWRGADGAIRGFPFSGLQWPVWYNTELLEQAGVAGVPETTDELIAAANKLSAADIQPFAIGGNDWSGTKLFMQMVQNYLDDDASKELLTNGGYCANPAAMKGVDLVIDLVNQGVFLEDSQGLSYDQMVASYTTGQAAIMYTGQWAFAAVSEEIVSATQFGGFPISSDSVWAKPTAYNSQNGVGISISQNGVKNIGAVEEFVKFMFQKSTVSNFAVNANVIPVVNPANVDATGADELFIQSVTTLPALVDYIPMPDDYVPGPVINALNAAVSLAFTKGNDSQTVCSALDAVYNSAK